MKGKRSLFAAIFLLLLFMGTLGSAVRAQDLKGTVWRKGGDAAGSPFTGADSLEVAMSAPLEEITGVVITGGDIRNTDWEWLYSNGPKCTELRTFIIEETVNSVADIPATTAAKPLFGNAQHMTVSLAKTKHIGDHAFRECKFTSLSLPDAEIIYNYSFYGCYMPELILPKVHTVGSNAFAHIWKVCRIEAPKLTAIGSEAFMNIDGFLKSFNGPEVVEVGNRAFSGTYSMERIHIPKCTTLSDNAFNMCSSLKEIELPELKQAGKSVFYFCSRLEKVDLPLLESVGEKFFAHCGDLKSLSLPKLQEIPEEMLSSCHSLETVNFPEATKVGKQAFAQVRSMKSIKLPKVAHVGEKAFAQCERLENITLPAVTNIEGRAFSTCESLRVVELPRIPPTTADLSNSIFDGTQKRTVFFVDADGSRLMGTDHTNALADYKADSKYSATSEKWNACLLAQEPLTITVTGNAHHRVAGAFQSFEGAAVSIEVESSTGYYYTVEVEDASGNAIPTTKTLKASYPIDVFAYTFTMPSTDVQFILREWHDRLQISINSRPSLHSITIADAMRAEGLFPDKVESIHVTGGNFSNWAWEELNELRLDSLRILSIKGVDSVHNGDGIIMLPNNLEEITVEKLDTAKFFGGMFLRALHLPDAVATANHRLQICEQLTTLDIPKLNRIGQLSLTNLQLPYLHLPLVEELDSYALSAAQYVARVSLPKLKKCADGVLNGFHGILELRADVAPTGGIAVSPPTGVTPQLFLLDASGNRLKAGTEFDAAKKLYTDAFTAAKSSDPTLSTLGGDWYGWTIVPQSETEYTIESAATNPTELELKFPKEAKAGDVITLRLFLKDHRKVLEKWEISEKGAATMVPYTLMRNPDWNDTIYVTFVMPNFNVEITTQLRDAKVNVIATVTSAGGGKISIAHEGTTETATPSDPASINVPTGGGIEVQAIPESGHELVDFRYIANFRGYEIAGDTWNYTIPLDANLDGQHISVNALFAPEAYRYITLNPTEYGKIEIVRNGSEPVLAHTPLKSKDAISLKLLPDAGYRLEEIHCKKKSGNSIEVTVDNTTTPATANFTMPADDVELSVKFEPIPMRTVTFDDQQGNTTSEEVEDGKPVAKPTDPTSTTGKNFMGWFTDRAGTQACDFNTPVTSDITLYAKWEDITWTVTFNQMNGTSTTETVKDGEKVSRPAVDPIQAGMKFIDWYADNAYTTVYDFNTPVTSDITLYAKWEVLKWTVTFDDQQGNTTSVEVEDGKPVVKPTDPTSTTGKKFIGWFTDKAGTQAYDFTTPVTKGLTLYAKWEEKSVTEWTVTFDTQIAGSTPTTVKVKDGDKVAKPTDPTQAGKKFVGWFTDKAGTQAYDFATPVTKDLTLYAKWEGGSPVDAIYARISLYPNPTVGSVKVDGLEFPAVVRVYSAQGSKVLEQLINPGEGIDLSPMPNGLYLIQILEYTLRVIKQ